MRKWVGLVVFVGCSSSKGVAPPPAPPPEPPAPVAQPTDAAGSAAPMPDLDDGITYSDPAGGSPGTVEAMTVYRSNCATTHPIARDTCQGAAISTTGVASCKSLHVKMFKPCKQGEPTCYVEKTCPDGHVAPSDFLECAAEQNQHCFTRSSRIYKDDIAYLSDTELADLAAQISKLRLARFRYKDTGTRHVGFIIEDEPKAAWVSEDGRRVDLYSLVSASIATLHRQDARIRQLEHDIEACKR